MFRLLVALSNFSSLLIFEANAARILCVYPTPSFSHQVVYRSLTAALVERGHDVVVITTHPFPPGTAPANLTEIDMYDISHNIWEEGINKVFHEKGNHIKVSRIYFKIFRDIFEKQMQSKPVQDLIKRGRDRFDLLLLESNIFPVLGLLNVFDAPAIQTSTFGPMPFIYSAFGTLTQPLLYPTCANLQLFNFTMWEAVNTLYRLAASYYVIGTSECDDNEILERNLKLDKDFVPISKLKERVHLFFQAINPVWIKNPPVPPGIVYLGGLHQKSPKDLPQELQVMLDASKNGVIYVSFGSNVHPSVMCEQKINMMARVFSKLPYDVIWKRDQYIQTNASKNIHVSTWFPQTDLLYHPKLKLFITQGGLQSSEEAITAGVPLIGIPIFGDQWMNTENYVHLRIGLQLEWSSLSEEQFTRSIISVIGDESYKENVVRLARVMNDQPQSARERALWWTEYVLQHGGAQHLLPAAANMTWLQYFEVELVITVAAAILLVTTTITYIVFKLVRCLCRKNRNKDLPKYFE